MLGREKEAMTIFDWLQFNKSVAGSLQDETEFRHRMGMSE